MAQTFVEIPAKKNQGQRSLGYEDAYLARFVPTWSSPSIIDGNAWRAVVDAQPIAQICRDTLISSILGLDWKVAVRDADKQDELRATAKYYTALFERAGYGSDLDWTSHVEWIAKDLLTLPFGGAAELGRKGDTELGRVQWIEPLDGATLYPTLNPEWPVIQAFAGQQVALPRYGISRTYMSPRTRMEYKGWGVAPPETIWIALNMLARGDTYYANLLLDVPAAGILDLGDMEKDSAMEWVDAFKALLANSGNSPFKIPVLYEHQSDVKFLPFGKVPNDIMFDRIIMQYASLVCAGYGMTLGDIGLTSANSNGDTLAGAIRSERKTRKTGYARLKKKLKYYFDQILPPTLEFLWVDYDDEVNVALGRARLSNATAMASLIDKQVITPNEARMQLTNDGMFTISMPEYAPTGDTVSEPSPQPNKRDLMGTPVPVSQGGEGEIRRSFLPLVYDMSALAVEKYEDAEAGIDILDCKSAYQVNGRSAKFNSALDTMLKTKIVELTWKGIETDPDVGYDNLVSGIADQLAKLYPQMVSELEGVIE